jgi:hypothetical protein
LPYLQQVTKILFKNSGNFGSPNHPVHGFISYGTAETTRPPCYEPRESPSLTEKGPYELKSIRLLSVERPWPDVFEF